jgi:hypothetical protein
MKLQAPNGTTGELHLHGRTFDIDKNGQVDVPDELVGSKLYADGYTTVREKTAVIVPAKPVAPIVLEQKESKL